MSSIDLYIMKKKCEKYCHIAFPTNVILFYFSYRSFQCNLIILDEMGFL